MHIVVVDSSRVVLKIITDLLEPRGNIVSTFTDSDAALAFVGETSAVRVIMTSLEVRPLGGLELCWSARMLADGRRPLYIIAMSSAQNARNLAEALDSGADDFIVKPLGAESLYARLRAAERLTTMQEELIRLAETDPLTGLLNRRAFLSQARDAARRVGAHGRMSAILADIDHFKRINDTQGHDVGDVVLQATAKILGQEGIVGRLGGEEFAILLPQVGLDEAAAFANRHRMRLADQRTSGPNGPICVTCSFGVSEWSESDTIEGLIKRADIALYEAKTSGRNRVVSAATDVIVARC